MALDYHQPWTIGHLSLKNLKNDRSYKSESDRLREQTWAELLEIFKDFTTNVCSGSNALISTTRRSLYALYETIILPIISNLETEVFKFHISKENLYEEMIEDEHDRILNINFNQQVNLLDKFIKNCETEKLINLANILRSSVPTESFDNTSLQKYLGMIDSLTHSICESNMGFEESVGGYITNYCEFETISQTPSEHLTNYINLMNLRLSEYLYYELYYPIIGVFFIEYMRSENMFDINKLKQVLEEVHVPDMIGGFTTLSGNNSVHAIVNSDSEMLAKDFSSWYVRKYGIAITRESRLTDFFKVYISEVNKETLKNARKFFKIIFNYLDKVMYKDLTNYLSNNTFNTSWSDVKEQVLDFLGRYELDVVQQYLTYKPKHGEPFRIYRDSIPVVPGTSIIGTDVPYMRTVSHGSYYIYSINGFKIHVPDAIEYPIQLNDDEEIFSVLRDLGVL